MSAYRAIIFITLLTVQAIAGEIHEAAAKGDIALLTALASRGPAARTSTDANGFTALHRAVIHRQAEAVRVLLAAGAPVDPRDREGNTPLHHLAHSVEESVVENFKSAAGGAFGDALGSLTEGGQAVTPVKLLGLLRSDLAGVEEPLKLLRNFAAATTAEQLEQELSCAKALIAAGADVDVVNRERSTPLHHAARSPWPDLARVLAEAGAKINAQNAASLTPLHNATLFGSAATVEYLLKMGAEPEGRAVLLGVPPIVMAVTRGERRMVAVMIEHHADVNALGLNGETALARAAIVGAADVAELLLANGARTNVQFGRTSQTPLHAASSRGFLPIVQGLLAARADVEAKDGAGFTPLIVAAEHGHTLVVRALLNAGAKINAANSVGRSALWMASSRGHFECVAYLMNHAADPLQPAADGQTPIHIAAYNARPAALRTLLERSPDLRTQSRIGTPLHAVAVGPLLRAFFAAQAKPGQKPTPAGSMEETAACGQLLLRSGAPLDAVDGNGAKPVHTAAAFGNRAVLELLLAKDESALQSADGEGLTLLHHAAHGPTIPGYAVDSQPTFAPEILAGCGEVVAFLLKSGGEIESRDRAARTPLHHAAAAGNLPALKALLEATAGVKAQDRSGTTPLHAAASRGRAEVVPLLLGAHASLKAIDAEGQTPLHVALAGGHAETVRLLLKAGADPNAVTRRGRNPLSYAESLNRPELVRLLRESGAKAPPVRSEE